MQYLPSNLIFQRTLNFNAIGRLAICFLVFGQTIMSGQCLVNKTAGSNPADVAALDLAYNIPSPFLYGDMIGINDAGQFQSIQNELNPISYLTTKMRAFHAMDYDFNEDPIFGVTQYTDLIKPKDVNGIPAFMDLGSYDDFIGPQGISNISAATEILIRARPAPLQELTWKEKIWQESDWWPASAGLSFPAGIRESYKRYTEKFIDVLAPNTGTRHIEVYQVGNELWDYPFEEDYHAMLEGAYDAFVNKYGSDTSNWKMKLMPGSFQAATITNTCPVQERDNSNCTVSGTQMFNQMGDYLDVSNCNILSSLHAINTHVYPFDEGTLNYVHPEKSGGEFERFKAAVAFRDANPILAGKGVWLTEVGYDSYGTGLLPNGEPAYGVGQYSQAAMLLRIFMLTSRYHLERVDFYMGFDQSRTSNIWHGGPYNSSGFWRLGTDPQFGWASAKPSHGATPKPVFFAFRNFLDKFEEKVFHEAVAEENDVQAYILANQDGSDPYLVFWSPTATDDNNVFTDITVNRQINLPSGYKVSTTSATPFSSDGNLTTAPYVPFTASEYTNAVSGTNVGSTTIVKVRRMPSYIKLDMGTTTNITFTSCPNDIIVEAAQGQNSAVVNWTAPTAVTSCTGSPSIVQASGGSNGSSFNIGTSTITYEATDDCGNLEFCSFTVTVQPFVSNPLNLSCPNNITTTIPQGSSGTTIFWNAPTATTNCTVGGCSGSPISGFNYMGALNGSAYYFSQNSEKWVDAKVTCENNGGHLVTISSQAEQDFIFNNIDVAILIGINDEDNNNSLEWVTGESISYTNWKVGQPNTFDMNRYGLLDFWTVGGLWEITNFWTNKPYVMEVPCGGNPGQVNITQTQGPPSGSLFNVGTTTISYAASDDCNNTDNCSFNIIVQEDDSACPQTIEITTADPTDINYQAGQWIKSYINGSVLAGANVSYKAGDYILLDSGFSVHLGAVFSAEIEACP